MKKSRQLRRLLVVSVLLISLMLPAVVSALSIAEMNFSDYIKQKINYNADIGFKNTLFETFAQIEDFIKKNVYQMNGSFSFSFKDNNHVQSVVDLIKRVFKYKTDSNMYYFTSYSYRTSTNIGEPPVYTITVTYSINKTTAQKVEEKIDQLVTSFSSAKTDFDKVKLIHDWIINNSQYTPDSLKDSSGEYPNSVYYPPSILFQGHGVCQAYSMLFGRIAERLGLNVRYVRGQNIRHGWNLVNVDGFWYHVDTTYDDPVVRSSNAKISGHENHDFFLVSDAFMNKTMGRTALNYSFNLAPYNYNDSNKSAQYRNIGLPAPIALLDQKVSQTTPKSNYPVIEPGVPRFPGSEPTLPSLPGTILKRPSLPSYPGSVPSLPSYPGRVPTLPTYPGLPGSLPTFPSYPGNLPTVPSYPGNIIRPSFPSYPGGTGTFPSFPKSELTFPTTPGSNSVLPVAPTAPSQFPFFGSAGSQLPTYPSGQIRLPGLSTSFAPGR